MSYYISASLRAQIEQADCRRCSYCQTQEAISGIPLSFDHIVPRSKGGETSFQNICLACRPCNEFKATSVEGQDPLTGEVVSLFNPRSQNWRDHFAWSEDGARLEGLTAVGRVTVIALQMNRSAVVFARKRWVSSGWHPPID